MLKWIQRCNRLEKIETFWTKFHSLFLSSRNWFYREDMHLSAFLEAVLSDSQKNCLTPLCWKWNARFIHSMKTCCLLDRNIVSPIDINWFFFKALFRICITDVMTKVSHQLLVVDALRSMSPVSRGGFQSTIQRHLGSTPMCKVRGSSMYCLVMKFGMLKIWLVYRLAQDGIFGSGVQKRRRRASLPI